MSLKLWGLGLTLQEPERNCWVWGGVPTLLGLPHSILSQATGPSPAMCKCALGTCQLTLLGEKEPHLFTF